MSKETIAIEGVLKSLVGLKTIMDTTDDTEDNAELGVRIQAAIDMAVLIKVQAVIDATMCN